MTYWSTGDPEATTYQVYFIPRWEPGQAVHLPTACVRNRRTEEYAKGRPVKDALVRISGAGTFSPLLPVRRAR